MVIWVLLSARKQPYSGEKRFVRLTTQSCYWCMLGLAWVRRTAREEHDATISAGVYRIIRGDQLAFVGESTKYSAIA
jgi:hypothetical protein